MNFYDMSPLEKGLKEFGISLSIEQMGQLVRYYEILVEWNEKMNLTAITDFNEVLMKHFLDSLSIVKAVDMSKVENMIDVGTGAGFPGIPIKIVFPNVQVTLLDSLDKRIKFLNHVIDMLKLENIDTYHGRAEDFAKPDKLREKYDLVVSRAVANLNSLSEYCIPYVKEGGLFVSYKAETAEEEMKAAKGAIFLLGGKEKEVIHFNLPTTDITRNLCVIEKKNKTPGKYPRKAGLPTKDPLK